MRYFLDISYKGTNFHGWQIQPNAESVQETIEKALSIILREPISITGAGRTDTGVHARKMYAHFDLFKTIPDKSKLLLSLNKLIGPEIAIKDLIPVNDTDHARFDAIKRSYKYFVTYSKDPFIKEYVWQSPTDLNLEKMNEAAGMLLNIEDFTSFAKLHSDVKTNLCDVSFAKWQKIKDDPEASDFIGKSFDGLVFTITADRFLRNMVRAIVGTLVEVGREKLSLEGFQNIIEGKNRSLAGTSMPAQGLFLWDISYPFLP